MITKFQFYSTCVTDDTLAQLETKIQKLIKAVEASEQSLKNFKPNKTKTLNLGKFVFSDKNLSKEKRVQLSEWLLDMNTRIECDYYRSELNVIKTLTAQEVSELNAQNRQKLEQALTDQNEMLQKAQQVQHYISTVKRSQDENPIDENDSENIRLILSLI